MRGTGRGEGTGEGEGEIAGRLLLLLPDVVERRGEVGMQTCRFCNFRQVCRFLQNIVNGNSGKIAEVAPGFAE